MCSPAQASDGVARFLFLHRDLRIDAQRYAANAGGFLSGGARSKHQSTSGLGDGLAARFFFFLDLLLIRGRGFAHSCSFRPGAPMRDGAGRGGVWKKLYCRANAMPTALVMQPGVVRMDGATTAFVRSSTSAGNCSQLGKSRPAQPGMVRVVAATRRRCLSSCLA